LAVFTSKYPARVATFFERDIRALLEAGIEVDIFPGYPLDERLWRYGLDILDERVLPRDRVHHLSMRHSLRYAAPWPPKKVETFVHDATAIAASAVRFGPAPLVKSVYVLPKAWAWAEQFPNHFDHVLAYWGNFAASCAFVFHRLTNPRVPFSIWLHAGTDLYRNPVFLRQKLLYADSIITCCEFNRRFITDQYADIADRIASKIHVCYHGLDLAAFPFARDGRPPNRVIAVGRLAKYKGFDYLLRAVHELNRRNIAVEVELMGDGEEAESLRALARELRIGDRVRFSGWVPFEAVREAMREATILVHPSPGIGDGLPNVIREAMALGTPVIASRVAGIPEALDGGRCGVLVPPRDVRALADAMEGLLTNAALRYRYAGLARRRAEERFDLWRNGARLADHLRSLDRPVQVDTRLPVTSDAARSLATRGDGC
jgi:glycosyltransferase involved in cell wall biosynthesis